MDLVGLLSSTKPSLCGISKAPDNNGLSYWQRSGPLCRSQRGTWQQQLTKDHRLGPQGETAVTMLRLHMSFGD